MKWGKILDNIAERSQAIIRHGIEGVGDVASNIAHGNISKAFDKAHRFIQNTVQKIETHVKKVIRTRKKDAIRNKQLIELGKQHDASAEFEHIKVSMERKQERLDQIQDVSLEENHESEQDIE